MREVEVDALDLESLERGQVHRLLVSMIENGAGRKVRVPVLAARGRADGPVVGVTAAVHGNELNGIFAIQDLMRRLPMDELRGAVVGVPIVNMPGFLTHQREYRDGKDLNRLMPGKPHGTSSQVYAHRFVERVLRRLEYLIDLHTASFGRVNSLYIRADMTRPETARIARLLRPQIIVHNEGEDGTLRAAAEDLGIHAVTVEVGDPQRLQHKLVTTTRVAIRDVLEHLKMLGSDGLRSEHEPVECHRSYWLYTDAGGLLEVLPKVAEPVAKDQEVARLVNDWGDLLRVYRAPEAGVVVGKSTNPVAYTGSRILHLGIVGEVESRTE
ncbi:MAG: succinylglutamate desuccinylase/aspartoacylase family protein [Planctomycetota bacterium]